MGLFGRSYSYVGTYFGSLPSHPKPNNYLVVNARRKNIAITWGIRQGIQYISWEDVISFDFSADATGGVYKTTLKTTEGNLEVEVGSPKIGSIGTQAQFSDQERRRLNKFKAYVIEQTMAHNIAE